MLELVCNKCQEVKQNFRKANQMKSDATLEELKAFAKHYFDPLFVE